MNRTRLLWTPRRNLYVTGSSEAVSASTDYATIKYDSNGSQIWTARYNGPGNSFDDARTIKVDSTGNVYVAGGSTGANGFLDYATIKYSASGSQLWVARYDRPGSGDDDAKGLAVDSSGNAYVTGHSLSAATLARCSLAVPSCPKPFRADGGLLGLDSPAVETSPRR